jgi:hypothetical protein
MAQVLEQCGRPIYSERAVGALGLISEEWTYRDLMVFFHDGHVLLVDHFEQPAPSLLPQSREGHPAK